MVYFPAVAVALAVDDELSSVIVSLDKSRGTISLAPPCTVFLLKPTALAIKLHG